MLSLFLLMGCFASSYGFFSPFLSGSYFGCMVGKIMEF